jgi:peptide deformylase
VWGGVVILKIAKMGHPVLRRKAELVTEEDFKSGWVASTVNDMFDTMEDYNGVGLAAPQVHISKRLAVVEVPEPDGIPPTPMINPVVTPVTEREMQTWEGCLSIPGLIGLVPRPAAVRVDYLDIEGKPAHMVVEGFAAAAVQHECDHLDGVLYIDRIKDPKTLMFTDEYERHHSNLEDDD